MALSDGVDLAQPVERASTSSAEIVRGALAEISEPSSPAEIKSTPRGSASSASPRLRVSDPSGV